MGASGPCRLAVFCLSRLCAGQHSPRKTKCESTDVVFVIDDTYSLQGAIYDIKQELEKILDKIDEVSGGDFQIGLVTFKDFVEVDEDMNATPDPQTKRKSYAIAYASYPHAPAPRGLRPLTRPCGR